MNKSSNLTPEDQDLWLANFTDQALAAPNLDQSDLLNLAPGLDPNLQELGQTVLRLKQAMNRPPDDPRLAERIRSRLYREWRQALDPSPRPFTSGAWLRRNRRWVWAAGLGLGVILAAVGLNRYFAWPGLALPGAAGGGFPWEALAVIGAGVLLVGAWLALRRR